MMAARRSCEKAAVTLAPFLLALMVGSGARATSAAPNALSFGDSFLGGAVLQREQPVTVWGTLLTAGPDEQPPGGRAVVVISVDGVQVGSGAPAADGTWSAVVPPQPASFESVLTATSAGLSTSVPVMWGDVLLCGGQSNMGLAVGTGPFHSGKGAPVYGFHADNGTAESAAAGKFTGKIQLKAMCGRPTQRAGVRRGDKNSTGWFATTPSSLPSFSAVCWYTGKALFEWHGGHVPYGLILGANGGTAIEMFLPKPTATAGRPGRQSKPQQSYCPAYPVTDCHQNVSQYGMFYETIIGKLGPFTVGALIWDQAEADLSCNHTGAQYSCLQTALVSSWRQGLGAREFPAVAVQLPGYSKDCASLVRKFGPNWDFCGGGSLLKMRLAQESGMRAVGAVGTHGVRPSSFGRSCGRPLCWLWKV